MPKFTPGNPLFIGVDPGKQGGLVCLGNKIIRSATPMPSSERDVWDWFSHISRHHSPIAVIERVHAMPKQGVSSTFKFGWGYGGLRMALTAAGIPFEDEPPQTWIRALSIPPKKKTENNSQWKERLRAKAQQLFPTLPLWKEPNSKGKQLAVADALLIAEFCRRQNS